MILGPISGRVWALIIDKYFNDLNYKSDETYTLRKKEARKRKHFLASVVRVERLELSASRSQSARATNCAIPGDTYEILIFELLPNQARYQLRYTRIFALGVF